MGCLNDGPQWSHWFGNIHLSGPCNRACYFCIGQHMMALDGFNNLDRWPLLNLEGFAEACERRGVREINLTGTNTDPLLYAHAAALCAWLRDRLGYAVDLGMRTNGIAFAAHPERWRPFSKMSVSVTSLDPELYQRTMGGRTLPPLEEIVGEFGADNLKANVVLCPETVEGGDYLNTIVGLERIGFRRINLREPYGQPHIGNPMDATPDGYQFGCPVYQIGEASVCYWDVHYCEVRSVNLYASGRISEDYPISKGHAAKGEVHDQSYWKQSGRHVRQWLA